MSSKLFVVVCLVLASLLLGVDAHHKALESSPLGHLTHKAHHSLKSLPSHCSTGAEELILAEESRVTELINTCSKRTIFLLISELMTDSSYYGFDLYNNGATLVSDWKDCSKEKYMFEKLFCVFEKSSGAVKAVFNLATGSLSYVMELVNYLPKLISEIKECKKSSVTGYQLFLDATVKKAIQC